LPPPETPVTQVKEAEWNLGGVTFLRLFAARVDDPERAARIAWATLRHPDGQLAVR